MDYTVAESQVCQDCGEARMDWLVWQDDEVGEYVRCATCGNEYIPNGAHEAELAAQDAECDGELEPYDGFAQRGMVYAEG